MVRKCTSYDLHEEEMDARYEVIEASYRGDYDWIKPKSLLPAFACQDKLSWDILTNGKASSPWNL